MGKLLQEADLDDRFNVQMKKVQDAIDKLDTIIGEMSKPGSMHKMIGTQRMQLRHAAEDFKRLLEKAQ